MVLDRHFVVDRAEGHVEDAPESLKCWKLKALPKRVVGTEGFPMSAP